MNHGADIWMIRLEPVAAPQIAQPLGYMYLAAYLRRAGFWNIRIIDVPAQGIPWQRILEEATRRPPAVVFLTACSVDMARVAQFSARMADAAPDAIQLVGGPHPTGDPEGTLRALPAVRAAVFGEGEQTTTEALETLEPGAEDLTGVLGLAFRASDGEIVVNPGRPLPPALDDDLWPAYDLIDIPSYFRRSRMGVLYKRPEYMTLMTSRGCTHGCRFCHEIFGRIWRPQSADRVVEELTWLSRKQGIREVQMADDLFNGSRRRTLDICDGIVRGGLDLTLCCANGLRADRLSDEEIEAMHAAGTWRICVAPETATPRLQELSGKRINLDRVQEVIRGCVRRGIFTSGFFMIGFPTETRAEIQDTIRWALDSELHTANFFRVIPFPGCRLRDDAAAEGLQVDRAALDFEGGGSAFNLSTLTPDEIESMHRGAMRAFYGDPRRMARIAGVMPLHPGLWPLYLQEALVRVGLGTNLPHLLGKATAPGAGLRAVLRWIRTGDAGASTGP